MNDMLHDYLVLDGSKPADEDGYYASLQRQINNGTIWGMQGSMGRAAMDAINSGYCLVGRVSHTDYYGNVVPGRDDLQDGTKGTFEFVKDLRGPEWAEQMVSVE